jgi:hypothetical protein
MLYLMGLEIGVLLIYAINAFSQTRILPCRKFLRDLWDPKFGTNAGNALLRGVRFVSHKENWRDRP